MGDGLRTIHVVTSDESLVASVTAAAEPLDGWEIEQFSSQEELALQPPMAGDVLLLDSWMRGMNVYEFCRMLTGRTHCRTFLVVEHQNDFADPIASFCGAAGVMKRPMKTSELRAALEGAGQPAAPHPAEGRGEETAFDLPESLLVDITSGSTNDGLVTALVDSETGLFNYAFLNYKLDEEFKRAKRFDHPLACVMLGFEGQANEDVLRELAAIFLESSRDTDVLGRFDENSFLFLLPNTGPDGARIMAERVGILSEERELTDLVGDPLVISVGIASCPHPDITQREDLYTSAREGFLAARKEGGGVVCCS